MANFRSFLKTCLTVGYHIRVTPVGRIVEKQDAFISSLLFMVLFLAFSISFSFTRWLTVDQSKPVTKPMVLIVLCIVMILCIGYLFVLTCPDNIRNRISSCVAKLRRSNFRVWLPLVGLTIFAIGAIVLDTFKIVVLISCSVRFDIFDLNMGSEISYSLIRCIFAVILTIFICVVNADKSHLYCASSLRYFIVTLVACLLWIYLETTLASEEDLYGEIQRAEIGTNVTSYVDVCVRLCSCKSTSMHKLYREFHHFLHPVTLEFCIIAVGCLITLFLQMKPFHFIKETNAQVRENLTDLRTQKRKAPPRRTRAGTRVTFNVKRRSFKRNKRLAMSPKLKRKESRTEEFNTTGAYYSCSKMTTFVRVSVRDQPEDELEQLLSSTSSQIQRYGSIQQDYELRERFPSYTLKFVVIIVFGTILNFAFIIMSVCLGLTDTFQTTKHNKAAFGYTCLKITYWCFAIYVLYRGLTASLGFRSKHMGYSVNVCLQLLSVFAHFTNRLFAFQAAIGTLRGSKKLGDSKTGDTNLSLDASLFLFDILVNCFQVYIQTLFYLHVINLDAKTIKHEKPREYATYRYALIYMIILNSFMWLLDSFIFTNSPSLIRNCLEYLTDGSWSFIMHVTYPLIIFYRFHSALQFVLLL